MDAAPDATAFNPRTVAVLAGLALTITLANAAKAPHVDDAAYILHAAHLARHPLAPYDFEIYWDYYRQPANQVLLPPVVPYWIAAAMRLFGDESVAWKLALLPLHMVLVFALFAVARRFAGSAALPSTFGLVLGPAVLPGINLMLDVPALALATASVALFFRACDKGGWSGAVAAGAVAAGAVAALAMQTKYTAIVVPPLLLVYGAFYGRRGPAVLAALTAVGLFAGWETLVALQQGESHFLLAFGRRSGATWDRVRHLALPLLTLPPALCVGGMLAAMAALTRSWRWPLACAAAVAAGFLLIGVVPGEQAVLTRAENGAPRLALESVLYGALALVWWGVVLVAVLRLLAGRPWDRATLFLLAWLALEIAGYFALSPFPAARRVLGVVVAASLLAARLVQLHAPDRRRWMWGAAGVSALCGAAVAWVDWQEARATQGTAAAAVVACETAGGRAWFAGTWGFQVHALGHGLLPLQPGETLLRRGDLLVLAEQQTRRIDFQPETAPLAVVQTVAAQDRLPWQTLACYYCGRTPVQHHEARRLGATVYRVLADFIPQQHGELPAVSTASPR
jgi:4-amino-4-deoxy-L-arabinose transferase-like glycosyltransferase